MFVTTKEFWGRPAGTEVHANTDKVCVFVKNALHLSDNEFDLALCGGLIEKKKWKPEDTGYFWYVADYLVVDSKATGDYISKILIKKGNYFQTPEEAGELKVRWKKVLEEYRKEIGL